MDRETKRAHSRRRRRWNENLLGAGRNRSRYARLGISDPRTGKTAASNFRLTAPERLRAILAELPKDISRAGVFLAGCATEEDRHALREICLDIWPNAQIVTGSDRDSGLAAALGHGDGIVVNAGSGSSVTGRRGDHIERAGGWGHILGDAGGGYFLVSRRCV